MKLSVMLFPFHKALKEHTLTPRELISRLAEHGAQAVETMHELFHDDPVVFQQLLDEIRRAKLAISCHDIGINLITSEDQREEVIRQATRKIQFARNILNTNLVLLYGSDVAPDQNPTEGRAICADTLKAIAEFADVLGVTATIEDFGMTPNVACKALHCREILLNAQPLPAMTFDTGNFFYAGETAEQAYPILKDYIRHVHVKDLNLDAHGKVQGTTVGNGIVNVKEICRLLKKDNYNGFLSIEIYGTNLDDATQALDVLKSYIESTTPRSDNGNRQRL